MLDNNVFTGKEIEQDDIFIRYDDAIQHLADEFQFFANDLVKLKKKVNSKNLSKENMLELEQYINRDIEMIELLKKKMQETWNKFNVNGVRIRD